MSTREATGERATRSGGASGGNTGRNTSGRQVLGKTEALGEFVFKFNTKDQADAYLRATEEIAEHVGGIYGNDMKVLVKYGTVKAFTKPSAPTGKDPALGKVTEYKADLANYHKEQKQYQDDKEKVFSVILGQCTVVVKTRLEQDEDFREIEERSDVVSLLGKLKEMAFGTGGVQEPMWALQTVTRRLAAINQGQTESLSHYYKRFKDIVEVVEAQWGEYYPSKLVDNTVGDDKAKVRKKYLACVFLAGADKSRYGKVTEDLNNRYLSGTNLYPASVEDALNLLANYQDHGSGGPRRGFRSDSEVERDLRRTVYAQTGGRSSIRCYRCGEVGHRRSECPQSTGSGSNRSGQQHNTVEEEEETHETSRSGRTRRPVSWTG